MCVESVENRVAFEGRFIFPQGAPVFVGAGMGWCGTRPSMPCRLRALRKDAQSLGTGGEVKSSGQGMLPRTSDTGAGFQGQSRSRLGKAWEAE